MKNVDMAVRIAKTVAVTAGICSSDVDDEFDSRSFTDGFAGKMKKKVGEWVDGIHAGDAIVNDARVPYIFFPDKYSGEFTDGNYVAMFSIEYSPNCENDGFQFVVCAELTTNDIENPQRLWDDKSCYTMHLKSFSGERAVLDKRSNAFTVGNIGDWSVLSLLNGDGVIDEYGVDAVGDDAEKGDMDIAKANKEFMSEEFGKIADGIRKKILAWLDSHKVIGGLSFDMGTTVNQHEHDKIENVQK